MGFGDHRNGLSVMCRIWDSHSRYFFAWTAVLTEFVGGVLLMVGFMTRPAALLNAILTCVAAFIYHEGNIVKPGLLAFFFMIMCISILLNGPGKYSIDYFIYKKFNNNEE